MSSCAGDLAVAAIEELSSSDNCFPFFPSLEQLDIVSSWLSRVKDAVFAYELVLLDRVLWSLNPRESRTLPDRVNFRTPRSGFCGIPYVSISRVALWVGGIELWKFVVSCRVFWCDWFPEYSTGDRKGSERERDKPGSSSLLASFSILMRWCSLDRLRVSNEKP